MGDDQDDTAINEAQKKQGRLISDVCFSKGYTFSLANSNPMIIAQKDLGEVKYW